MAIKQLISLPSQLEVASLFKILLHQNRLEKDLQKSLGFSSRSLCSKMRKYLMTVLK